MLNDLGEPQNLPSSESQSIPPSTESISTTDSVDSITINPDDSEESPVSLAVYQAEMNELRSIIKSLELKIVFYPKISRRKQTSTITTSNSDSELFEGIHFSPILTAD